MTDLFDLTMAATVEPIEFIAGDLVMWRRTDDLTVQYLGGAYSLTYLFRPASGGMAVEIDADAGTGEWSVVLSSTTTADMVPGRWYWTAFITRISDDARVQVGDGETRIEANRATDPRDTRSHARRVLDAIEAAIEGRAEDTVQSYTIGGRQINKMSPDELIKWRNYYISQVATEDDDTRRKLGKPAQNTIRMRFV